MLLAEWRARRARKTVIDQILGEIVTAARRPRLYEAFGAPDRIDGRFEVLTLHAGLVLRRLVAIGGLGEAIAQDLVNGVFMHFDDALREMAYSDVGVARRLKTMGAAFYGRNAAYAASLDSGSLADLAAALARNVYGTTSPGAAPHASLLAAYVGAVDMALTGTPLATFAAGEFRYPDGRIGGAP